MLESLSIWDTAIIIIYFGIILWISRWASQSKSDSGSAVDNFLKEVTIKEKKTKQKVEEEFFSEVRTSSIIKRFATVDEVPNTITYLVSPLSSATNGAAIKVGGGSMGGII